MGKLLSILLIILGLASLINGITQISDSLLLASVNIFAAIILLYVGIQMMRKKKENETNKK